MSYVMYIRYKQNLTQAWKVRWAECTQTELFYITMTVERMFSLHDHTMFACFNNNNNNNSNNNDELKAVYN